MSISWMTMIFSKENFHPLDVSFQVQEAYSKGYVIDETFELFVLDAVLIILKKVENNDG